MPREQRYTIPTNKQHTYALAVRIGETHYTYTNVSAASPEQAIARVMDDLRARKMNATFAVINVIEER